MGVIRESFGSVRSAPLWDVEGGELLLADWGDFLRARYLASGNWSD